MRTTLPALLAPSPIPKGQKTKDKGPKALAVLALTLITTPALAVSPQIRGISPVGGQRGTEVTVTFSGQRLTDGEELLFYQPGISVTKLTAGKDDTLVATLKIDDDAPLGLHDFRLRSRTGISPLKTFSVGVLKEVAEVEPNNDFAKPQPIPLNVTINGVADREDIDYYAITAKKGERITAEVEGIRLGLTLFDPYVAILDTKRFELKTSDDSALIWVDGLVSLVAPEDGTYIVAVREAAYNGNTQCLYRLHVGNFPRPTAVLPAGGKLGEDVTVHWIGDVLGETTTELTLPDHPDRNFGLLAHDARGTAPYPNAFRLSPFGNIMEAEPNDTPEKATPFTPPLALNGVMGTAGDIDHFTFSAKKGQTYDIRVYARQIRSPLDAVLTLSAKGGGNIARNDDFARSPDSYIRFNAPKDGDYILALADHLKKGGPDYAYRVEISPVAAMLTLSTPNEALRRGIPTQAIAVPRGNRQAILINAARAEFGGTLALGAVSLPAGVTFEADEMTSGTVPVVFRADASAPVAATFAQVTGKPVDSKLGDIPTAFESTCELVLGQNNVVFWSRTVDSLAVAVTEEAPFSIEVVEPKVPIVRNGAMDLKVIAKRKPGFKAPIAVQLPWNPPGISSKQDIVIAEDEDSAVIPVNANGGAELRTWKIVVNGTYTEPPPAGSPVPKKGGGQGRGGFRGGRLTVSSELTKLTVAAPYLALKFNAVSVEQGKDVDLAVEVQKLADFPGEAKVTLVGLPNKVATEPTTLTKDTSGMVFHVKTDEASPAGETKNLFCQVVVTVDGEPIVHNLGTGRLRIDKPIVKKATGTGGKAAATGAKGTADKPLSRLEKLRLESKERAKGKEEGGK